MPPEPLPGRAGGYCPDCGGELKLVRVLHWLRRPLAEHRTAYFDSG